MTKHMSDDQASEGRPDRSALFHKDFTVQLKATDDSGSFEAYVAVFGNVDRQGDVIAPGAFTNLDEFVKSGWIGFNHHSDRLPVAYVDAAVQDAIRDDRRQLDLQEGPVVNRDMLAQGFAVPRPPLNSRCTDAVNRGGGPRADPRKCRRRIPLAHPIEKTSGASP